MARRSADRKASTGDAITFPEIAEAVEDAFGLSPIGLKKDQHGEAADAARSAFAGLSLHLMVKQRTEPYDAMTKDIWLEQSKAARMVRKDLAGLLDVDVNEVFRLCHHAMGLRAKDAGYRSKLRALEQGIAKKHGMVV